MAARHLVQKRSRIAHILGCMTFAAEEMEELGLPHVALEIRRLTMLLTLECEAEFPDESAAGESGQHDRSGMGHCNS